MDRPNDLQLSIVEDPSVGAVPVLSLEWSLVRAAFPSDRAPLLLIGQAVELGFRGAALDGLEVARGIVVGRLDDDQRRTYDFQLEHAGGSALDSAINRRASVRVAPDPGAPVLVRLRTAPEEAPVQTLMRDISTGGLSVLIGREQEWLLARSTDLWIQVRLPGCSDELELRGRVVHRRLERTAVHYGIELRTGEPSAERPLAAIRAFVESRLAVRRAAKSSDAA